MIDAFEFLSGRRILVTGASGFLGTHLCDRLSQSGAEIHALSRVDRTGDRTHPAIRWWQGTVDQVDAATTLLRTIQPHIIYHLAGHATGAAGLEHLMPTLTSQLVSVVSLLTAATEIGCDRIILTASLEEPDPSQQEITPISPYAAAKWAAGGYARMFHTLYQTPVVLARPFMTYGPGQSANKIIPSVTRSLLQGEAPKLGSGQRPVDWVYVEDVIDGFLAIAQAPGIEGLTFDLGSGDLVSIRAMVEQLVELVNPDITPLFGALPDRPVEKVRVADLSLPYAKLGWKPMTSLKSGLTQTIKWYRHQLVFGQENFDGSKTLRI